MEIKGTAVKITPEFVKKRFKDRYYDWLENMPEKSREIVGQPIFATSWFDLYDSVIIPTKKVGEMFFNSEDEAALELGRYSSEIALQGIYKIFVKISSPSFVLSRATNVFATYYNPAEIQIINSSSNSCIMQLKGFKKSEELIIKRIAGWLEKTIELTTKKVITPDINLKFDGEFIVSTLSVEW